MIYALAQKAGVYPLVYRMVRDPADQWLLADARRRDFRASDCDHDPACRSGVAHYEREFGIMLPDGPSSQRVTYNEVIAGLMTSDDIAVAGMRERSYTRERLDKKKRGHKPGPASGMPCRRAPQPS